MTRNLHDSRLRHNKAAIILTVKQPLLQGSMHLGGRHLHVCHDHSELPDRCAT